jgi:ABC-type uncharacterized transport system auxiliary subunit
MHMLARRPARALGLLAALLAASALCGCGGSEQQGAAASASPVEAVTRALSASDDAAEAELHERRVEYEQARQEREAEGPAEEQ